MAEYYLIIKALHIIFLIAWMAGMLYLPRLFVYHVNAKPGGELDKTLQIMERKLLRVIINPAMIMTLILGVLLMQITGALSMGGWMHAKLACLVILFILHGMMARCRKDFANGVNTKTERFYRIFNEVPAVLMVAIVVLVVLKPF